MMRVAKKFEIGGDIESTLLDFFDMMEVDPSSLLAPHTSSVSPRALHPVVSNHFVFHTLANGLPTNSRPPSLRGQRPKQSTRCALGTDCFVATLLAMTRGVS